MSCLRPTALVFAASGSSKKRSESTIRVPNLRFGAAKKKLVLENTNQNDVAFKPLETATTTTTTTTKTPEQNTVELYAILEAVSDRVEMHDNVGRQRENWNALLLNSVNPITLTATTLAGVAGFSKSPATSLSAAVLFSAAAVLSVVMSKIQLSQLAEEQRNAARLFRKMRSRIRTDLALGEPSEADVSEAMEKVLSLDRAYPLPLLGAMLEKFPERYEPAVWWPERNQRSKTRAENRNGNGWSEELESEMRALVEIVKSKDGPEYERLGSLVLKLNKTLAVLGPLLTGFAALSAPFIGHESSAWPLVVAVIGGSLASAVHALQHGGQVGMVFEMYRNCGGFFKLLEKTIEDTLEENDFEERESGELFRLKVALQLGRSLPEMAEIVEKSAIDEFASKLF